MSRPDKVEIPMSRNRRVWLARLLRSAAQRLDPSPVTVDRNPGGGATVKFHDRPLAHVVTGDQIQDTRIGTPHDAPRTGDTR